MPSENRSPRLYSSLASWFHLLTSPADYAEEAEFVRQTFVESSDSAIHTILELGSGGGNNASHLKSSFQMTLVDLSLDMLELSRGINPECEHIAGDMRNVRLGREFDAVLIHDAVMHMTTAEALRQCMGTAFIHCKPGGIALFMPDLVKETFASGVHHGGHDEDSRSLRYVEWTIDPDPDDSTYTVDFACMLREGTLPLRIEHDAHVYGLFSRVVWITLLKESGFTPRLMEDPYDRQVFVCTRV